MNEKDILKALGGVDPDYIADAAPKEKTRRKIPLKIRIIAAVICVSLLTSAIIAAFIIPKIIEKNSGAILPDGQYNKYVLAVAKYPKFLALAPNIDNYSDTQSYLNAYADWKRSVKNATVLETDTDNLDYFFEMSAKELLISDSNENAIYSPLSIYVTLSMLCEVTEGETRAQILELLNVDNIETLRKQACAVLKHSYIDDGANKSILANSLWFPDELSANTQTINMLSEKYYASSYKGDFKDNEFVAEYCKWINEKTGNLFGASPDLLPMDDEAAISIVSALDFYANWERLSQFRLKKVEEGVFHTKSGDVGAEFMVHNGERYMFGTEKFYAVNIPLQTGGVMWFVLPLENSSTNEVISDESFMKFLTGNAELESKKYQMTLSIPKFDVKSEKNIDEELKNLGVKNAFEEMKADFSAISDNELYLDNVTHGARVKIDEKGIVGGAYVQAPAAFAASLPDGQKIELTLDRPFIFAVTTHENLPLFVGVVNDPTK